MDLDIVAIVIKTSDINIPSGKYKLETLDKLTKEQDLERRVSTNDDGISYLIIDQNTSCPLYDTYYLFGKNNGGIIRCLEQELQIEDNELSKSNLKMILDNYYKRKEEKVL